MYKLNLCCSDYPLFHYKVEVDCNALLLQLVYVLILTTKIPLVQSYIKPPLAHKKYRYFLMQQFPVAKQKKS